MAVEDRNNGIVHYFQPRYSATIAGKAVVSASILDLIGQGASAEIDFSALNVFLRTGFYIGASTPFRHIRATVPPDPASLGVTPTDLRREAVIGVYIDLFRQAVQRQIQRCAGQSVCMGLSGGRDSRHILLELCRAGAKPDLCWTVDLLDAPTEFIAAQAVAVKAGVPQKTIPSSESVRSERSKNLATSFESVEHAWITGAIPVIQSYQATYDGLAGDVLSAGLFLSEERVRLVHQGRIDELIEKIVVDGRKTAAFLIQDQTLFPVQDALQQVTAEFRRHLAMPNPLGSFYLWNRTRRTIGASAFGLLRPSGQYVATPYLDIDLFRFLSSIPDSLTVDHALHTDAIRRAFPEFADIPFADKLKLPHPPGMRKLAIETACYLMRSRALLDKRAAVIRLFRPLVSPAHLKDVRRIHSFSIYLTQLGLASTGHLRQTKSL
ncbi:MAG: hypothetical protein ACYDD2_13040 [Candidatus Acidiferrales bacterium]